MSKQTFTIMIICLKPGTAPEQHYGSFHYKKTLRAAQDTSASVDRQLTTAGVVDGGGIISQHPS